jgi:hypothetical protein
LRGRVVIGESKEDFNVLEQFFRTLWGAEQYQKYASRVAFLPVNGSPLSKDINAIEMALRTVIGTENDISAFVISDRDYLLDEDFEEENRKSKPQEWNIWRRIEIENYLLNVETIIRFCKRELTETPLYKLDEDDLRRNLEAFVEKSRTTALDRLMNKFQEQERKRTPATCRQLADDFLKKVWNEEDRFVWCDAKEIVLPSLRDWLHSNYRISMPNKLLAAEFNADEISEEIKQLGKRLLRFAGL